ncbi:hypothetical protein Dsin_001357 [Dipteronia sinensis]|uniref:Uncharacterized protein n=1 Tax=Dipteronia sinensis TaxID=43782 RepID=A0AAE0EID4_9ROSI|nr:hypothetical protein Dsin_001357 [Dipteronia sinensis]
MTSKAITGPGSERTETKRPVWYVAIDSKATRRWQAHSFRSTTASTQSTYLKAIQLSSGLIHHHQHHLLLHQWHHLH